MLWSHSLSWMGLGLRTREKYPDDDEWLAKMVEYREAYHGGDIICINCGYELNYWELYLLYLANKETPRNQPQRQHNLDKKLNMHIESHARLKKMRTAIRGVDCRFIYLHSIEGRKTARFYNMPLPNLRENLLRLARKESQNVLS